MPCLVRFFRICLETLLQACNFIKKEALAQVLSCEFCKIFKSTFFTEHLWTTDTYSDTFRLEFKSFLYFDFLFHLCFNIANLHMHQFFVSVDYQMVSRWGYLNISQTSLKEFFCENSLWLLAVNYILKKIHHIYLTGFQINFWCCSCTI